MLKENSLEESSVKVEIEQKITDSYSDINSPKTYEPMCRASAESSREVFTPLKIRCLENNCNNTTAMN